jgi:hypothetical protein
MPIPNGARFELPGVARPPGMRLEREEEVVA